MQAVKCEPTIEWQHSLYLPQEHKKTLLSIIEPLGWAQQTRHATSCTLCQGFSVCQTNVSAALL